MSVDALYGGFQDHLGQGLAVLDIDTDPTAVEQSAGEGAGQNTYAFGECTWYMANLLPWVRGGWGDAFEWLSNAASAGFATSSTPVRGAIAVWGQNMGGATGSGHVAYVTGVDGSGYPIVSEMNFYGDGGGFDRVDTRDVSADSATGIIGYILPPPGAGTPNPPGGTTPQGQGAGLNANPLDAFGLPGVIGGLFGQGVGAVVGEAAVGVVQAIAGALEGFVQGVLTPWFAENMIPLGTGAAVAYIVLGDDLRKDAGNTVQVITGSGRQMARGVLAGSKAKVAPELAALPEGAAAGAAAL